MNSKNKNVLYIVVQVLKEIGDETIIFPMISLYSNTSEEDLRLSIVEAIGNIKSPKGTDFLISALKDENGHIRSKASEALGEIKVQSLLFI